MKKKYLFVVFVSFLLICIGMHYFDIGLIRATSSDDTEFIEIQFVQSTESIVEADISILQLEQSVSNVLTDFLGYDASVHISELEHSTMIEVDLNTDVQLSEVIKERILQQIHGSINFKEKENSVEINYVS